MTLRIWGAGSGAGSDNDFATAANWTGDTLPVNDDDLVFPDDAPACTGSMNQVAKHFGKIIVENCVVGATGSPLIIDGANETDLLVVNDGECYIDGKITVVTGQGGILQLDGTIATFNPFGGTITVVTGANITLINHGSASSSSGAAKTTIPAGVTLSTVRQKGGTLANSSAITTLERYGGSMTHSAGAITTLTNEGGTLTWDDGNITTGRIFGGTLDGSGGTAARSITTIERYPGSTVNLANKRHNITVGTDRYFGGSEKLDIGREYALS